MDFLGQVNRAARAAASLCRETLDRLAVRVWVPDRTTSSRPARTAPGPPAPGWALVARATTPSYYCSEAMGLAVTAHAGW